jgi:hypothetical protein
VFPINVHNLLDKRIEIESISTCPGLVHRNKIHECTLRLCARVHTWQTNNYYRLQTGLVSIDTMPYTLVELKPTAKQEGGSVADWKIQSVTLRMSSLMEPLPHNHCFIRRSSVTTHNRLVRVEQGPVAQTSITCMSIEQKKLLLKTEQVYTCRPICPNDNKIERSAPNAHVT